MAPCVRGRVVVLALMFVMPSLAAPALAGPSVEWAPERLAATCEAPNVFYSSQHVAGHTPCCPTIEGMCAGGTACPPSQVCADGTACVPGPVVDRPNVLLYISDDQGYCDWGSAEECRSTQSGTPIPAPKTPNLDLLAAYGTVFPIAHDSASWCFPSVATIFTGRFQKDFPPATRKVTDAAFSTLPSIMRGLAGDATAPNDPYNAGDKVGGYCTLLGGKFISALDKSSFDSLSTGSFRKLGRSTCVGDGSGGSPACGTAVSTPYAPFTTGSMTSVLNFIDLLLYRQPGTAQYTMEHFFVWYFPHLPHEPLRPPPAVLDYLFGGSSFPLGGVMDLGQWCSGGACASAVTAFNENNFGTLHQYYGNVWWTDDALREWRHLFAAESAPHCIGSDGRSRFDVATPNACTGTWSSVTPDLERNTVIIYLTDNGAYLPNAKHAYTENGYRTRLLVYDPRSLPLLPSWDAEQQPAPPAQTSPALAHAVDVLPTMLGYALGTAGSQSCPVGPDGIACDGRDLRPQLVTAPGGAAPPEQLRHALCGHHTKRVTMPTLSRYLVTRPGSVGRCTSEAASSCSTAADCAAGQFCLGGHCAPNGASTSCATTAACGSGAVCLGGACRQGPVCLDDGDCTALLGPGYVCGGRDQRWCRNDPNVACTTDTDCPVCPSVDGNPVPCSRLCEPRILKFYANPGTVPGPELSDLFLDPDEKELHSGTPGSLVSDLSKPTGGYANAMARMNCCIDAWWPDVVAQTGTLCSAGLSCPSDLTCNE
jgi:hypothetical protein